MRIAVVGAGAVGGYFGARLAAAGHAVSFVARGACLQALRARGLQILSPLGDLHVEPVDATDDPAAIGAVDLVLVCVKAWQVAAAAAAIGPLVGAGTAVVPLQNGVDAAAELAAALPPERVLDGLCKIISASTEPGVIHHLGAEPIIELGEREGPVSARVERIAGAIGEAGIRAIARDDIRAAVWAKFLFIAAVSGVGALTRSTLGEIRERPETRVMLERVMREVAAVARAQRIALPADVVDRTMGFIDRLPPGTTSSMQRDIVGGRPSELDAQTGAVVRHGAAAGVATPVNQLILAALVLQEARSR